MLVAKYHVDFAVVRRGQARRFTDLAVAYQNGSYTVLKVAAPVSQP